MTLNITAISSALSAPIGAEPRTRPGTDESSVRPAHNANDLSPPSDAVVLDPLEAGFQPQAAKSRETRAQESPSQPQEAKSEEKSLKGMIDELNQQLKSLPKTHLEFTIDEKANQVVVKVIDTQEKKLIRQIPPEDLLKLAASIREKLDSESKKTEWSGLVANKSAAETAPQDSFLLRDQA